MGGLNAAARDVFYYWRADYYIVGLDVMDENIHVTRRLHPDIANQVYVADLSRPLDDCEHLRLRPV